ncbi:addiction module protein [Candidatus Binatia bacterium]|nr:addiction module protein [Candidatus Binatia bacterium]
MKAQPDEIETAALDLAPEARLRIAHALVRSLESEDPEVIRGLWIDEAERRDAEMDEGVAVCIPGDEVLGRVRSKYR